jgi:hypothetical protein
LQADDEGHASALFAAHLASGRQLGERGFPTLFFANAHGKQEMIFGVKLYQIYEQTVLKLQPLALK